jgi:catechol 2,3-dioxygenase-like lactoylglutathione lyase family enzyme
MPLINGPLQAVSIVTNTWAASLQFYGQALGYDLLAEGQLTARQRALFGEHLGRYALLGHAEGAVVRLLETADATAPPHRLGARPWDLGLGVLEAGTPDVLRAYERVLRHRFGAISEPAEFDAEGPEPLGLVVMRSAAFMGPAGEQIFVTQIVRRTGGVSLLKESAVPGINAPANVVVSLRDRAPIEQFWRPVLGIGPVNDLPMVQPLAAKIMGGPPQMGFDMLLMGYGQERIGLEQHIYGPHNQGFDYQTFPCSFANTGLASACWPCPDLAGAKQTIAAAGMAVVSDSVGLPLRHAAEPEALVLVGPVGELIELSQV